ncbi:MAG: molybdopterin-dependent oxidoreductase [Planctomycetes bacterium]|nr:molybdopterin-dependent oxidoreductase [Planctomycetota bacterium]
MREVKRTACNRDCPDTCAMIVTVEDGRAVRLQGDKDDPVTQGFLCERTSRFLGRQYAPDRFTRPMLRRDGTLEPIDWKTALDLAADRLRQAHTAFGPASILHYRSGGSLGLLKTVVDHFFERFGPVTIKRGDICSGAGEAAQEADFGIADSHDLDDLENAQLILLWGKNPHVSGPHLLPVLKRARKAGTTILGIDPLRTRAASLCDAFLQPRPGTDFALAMAFARRVFDRGVQDPELSSYCDGVDDYREWVHRHAFAEWLRPTGLSTREVEPLADLYAERSPAAILVGWGLARRRNGGASVRALDALGLLRGNVGIPGGGVSYYFQRRAGFDTSFVRGIDAAPRTFAEARLGEEILAARDPTVQVIWVTAGNPLAMLPNARVVREAFERVPFKIVCETHPTDTTDVADLVFPVPTLLEDEDLLGAYGHHWLRASHPVMDRPADVRHELEIVFGLARRLGLDDIGEPGIAGWKQRLLRKLEPHGLTLDTLAAGTQRNPVAPRVQFADRRFRTPNGRAQLLTTGDVQTFDTSDALPHTLLAVSCPELQSSQRNDPAQGLPEARVHPRGAGAGFDDGSHARVVSRLGHLDVVVRHDENVHPEVIHMDKGGMQRDGRCANLLVHAVETDLGGGAAYYDEPVALRALP